MKITPYEIAFKPSVEKDLRTISAKVRARILSRIAETRIEGCEREPRSAAREAFGEEPVGQPPLAYELSRSRCHLTISVSGVPQVSTSAPSSPRSTVLEMK